MWTPLPAEAVYYSTPSPADHLPSLPQLIASFAGSVPSDPTYGRSALERSPAEKRLRDEYPTRDGKVTMDDAGLVYVVYQVWEPKEGTKARASDLIFVHGINDYGAKFSEHARAFLDEGYRVIVLDLPSHGRSTGIHVYIPELDSLADAVFAVLADVKMQDAALAKKNATVVESRKVFVAGQSLGGFVAVLTCLKYGSLTPDENPLRPQISGGLFLCPMLEISQETRPHWAVEAVARGIAYFGGPLPLAAANKGKNSEDPTVEEQFNLDPMTYHGKLRVGTGLSILKSLTELSTRMGELKVPFSLHHGTGDRVTSYHGSERLLAEASSTDKEIRLYPDYQHILLRKGKDEADDIRRQTVLKDMLDWLSRH